MQTGDQGPKCNTKMGKTWATRQNSPMRCDPITETTGRRDVQRIAQSMEQDQQRAGSRKAESMPSMGRKKVGEASPHSSLQPREEEAESRFPRISRNFLAGIEDTNQYAQRAMSMERTDHGGQRLTQLSRTSTSPESCPPRTTLLLPEEREREAGDVTSAQLPFLGKAADASDMEDLGSQEPSRRATGWLSEQTGTQVRGLPVGRPHTLPEHTHTPADEWVGGRCTPCQPRRNAAKALSRGGTGWAVGGPGHQRGQGQRAGRWETSPTAREQGT